MEIGFDATPLQTQHRFRGIGTYTRELVRAVMEVAPEHQVTLFALPGIPIDPGMTGLSGAVRVITPGQRLFRPRLVRLMCAPAGVGPTRSMLRRLAQFAWFQFVLPLAVMRSRVSVFHQLGLDSSPTVPVWQPRPTIVTVHDLAPALFPGEYLRTRYERVMYWLMLRAARRAKLIITDSETCRDEVLSRLRRQPSSVSAVALGTRIPAPGDGDSPARLTEMGIRTPYVLYVGTSDHVKNLERQAKAFEIATRRLEMPLTLVVVGPARGQEWEAVLSDDVRRTRLVLLGFVAREDLDILYGGALTTLACYLYQGFGLPILEAMAAGSPVITSDRGSMREVGEGAALLVDPTDVEEIAAALVKVCSESEPRRSLIRAGALRAGSFDWKETARLTLRAYGMLVPSSLRPAGVRAGG